ncbi:MAG TPA: hypothetical protein VK509_24470, partial [Polyangiales bacterium]|nr:hypothetical protein [Polyangiales bacterium]
GQRPKGNVMNHMLRLFVLLFATASLFACGKQPAAPEAHAATAKHADEGVVPGSHEDWCSEHQVPESMCTRCNPTLIAAFKATGDWCEEHGLPESQCLICNPELKIVRPPPTKAP